MLDDFKAFIFRGNLLDLALAVILGIAFGAVINAFTDGIIMAFIAALFGQPSFDSITIGLGDGALLVGVFITAVVNFLIVAGVLFLIMKLAEAFMRRRNAASDTTPAPTDETVLLTEIRDLLRAATQAR